MHLKIQDFRRTPGRKVCLSGSKLIKAGEKTLCKNSKDLRGYSIVKEERQFRSVFSARAGEW